MRANLMRAVVAMLMVATVTFAAAPSQAETRTPKPAAKMSAEQYERTLAFAVAVEKARYEAVLRLAVWMDHQKAKARYEAILRFAVMVEAAKQRAQLPSGACGGDLPTCAIMMCESGGDIHAENPSSSASGKWQILSSTWGGFGGYRRAADAPEWVQDARARQIWAGGAGRSQWSC